MTVEERIAALESRCALLERALAMSALSACGVPPTTTVLGLCRAILAGEPVSIRIEPCVHDRSIPMVTFATVPATEES